VSTVLSWGRNVYGGLGQGAITADSLVPAGVKNLPGKADIVAAGIGNHQCAVVSGEAYCWGYNNYGQLGNGTAVNSNVPVKVLGLEGKTVTGIGVGTAHTCAIANGAAYCWGNTGLGQMGNGTTVAGSQLTATPVTASGVLAGKTVTAITVGGNHACAIANGAAYCWGRSAQGQIGYIYGNTTQQVVPAAVGTVNMTGTVTSISAGNQHTCAVAGGKAYCWGAYTAGELGSTKTVNQWEPIAVTATAGVLGGKTVTSITTGGNHSCAIAGGTAYCWGSNGWGQLGINNTTSGSDVPVPVVGLTGTVTELSANATNTCAITNDVPYCWGVGNNGANGDGTTTRRNAATPLAGITGPVAHISAGNLTGLLAYK
jgi:alpha-tubulin suppressor-like RCC1 family protein